MILGTIQAEISSDKALSARKKPEFKHYQRSKSKIHATFPDFVVSGSDARGAWYGVQALLQLFRWDDSSLVVPCVGVADWPDFAVRAMMLTLGSSTQMDFLRHTLCRVLPRQRVNMVFVGGASIGKVSWPSIRH